MTPGERLRAWRGKRPLREVGEELGCDPSYVAYLEKGERTPILKVAVLIEQLAGIPAALWVAPASPPASSDSGEHDVADPKPESGAA